MSRSELYKFSKIKKKNSIRLTAVDIKLEAQNELRALVRATFEKKCANGPKFSLRAFARFLGISPGNLSQFLNNKKNLSIKTISRILVIIEKNPEIRKKHLARYENFLIKRKKETLNSTITYEKIEQATFAKVKEPIYFSFLNFIETDTYKSGLSNFEIANKLKISTSKLNSVIEVLLTEKLITKNSDQQFLRTATNFSTNDDISDNAIKLHNQLVLKRATEAIHSTPVDLCDFTSLTLPVNLAQIPKAKVIIRKFQDELIDLLNQSPKQEVYHLAITLFPATE